MLVNSGSSNVSLLVGLSPGLRKYLGPAPWASWTAYSLLYCFFSRYWSDFGIQERSKDASVVLPVADVDKSFSHPPLDRAARTEHCLWCFLWLALKFSAISSELFIAAFQRQIREIHLLTFFFLHKSWSHHISFLSCPFWTVYSPELRCFSYCRICLARLQWQKLHHSFLVTVSSSSPDLLPMLCVLVWRCFC